MSESELGFDDDAWMRHVAKAESAAILGELGRWQILERIGAGGQGVVYRARDSAGNEVALKRLVGGAFASPERRARFEREIAAASRLAHPNIVRVLDREFAHGAPTLVMEWVDGVAIDEWASGRSVQEVVTMGAKLSDAVHHAHQRGILHRDLKPSNILVDGRGEPQVLDFGLAKRIDASEASRSHTSGFVGTIASASPEQLGGEELDVRTDVYAVGVLLYEMLTGTRPYRAAASFAEMVDAIRESEPAPPSTIDARLDREIDTIVLKALHRDRSSRYQSVEALGNDLRRYLRGQPLEAVPHRGTYVLAKLLRRHPTASFLVGTMLLLLVGLAATATILAFRLSAERDRVAAAEQLRTRDWNEAWTILRFLEASLTASGTLPETRNVRQVIADTKQRLASELERAPEIAGEVHLSLARVHIRLGEFDEATEQLRALHAILQTPRGWRSHAAFGFEAVTKKLGELTGKDLADLALPNRPASRPSR